MEDKNKIDPAYAAVLKNAEELRKKFEAREKREGKKEFYSPFDPRESRKYYPTKKSCQNRMRKTNPEAFEGDEKPEPLYRVVTPDLKREDFEGVGMSLQEKSDAAGRAFIESMKVEPTKKLEKKKSEKKLENIMQQPTFKIDELLLELEDEELKDLQLKSRNFGKRELSQKIKKEMRSRGIEVTY